MSERTSPVDEDQDREILIGVFHDRYETSDGYLTALNSDGMVLNGVRALFTNANPTSVD